MGPKCGDVANITLRILPGTRINKWVWHTVLVPQMAGHVHDLTNIHVGILPVSEAVYVQSKSAKIC